MTDSKLPTGALIVRAYKGNPFYEARWQWDGRQVGRRIGPAWLVPDPDGDWKKRRGRTPEGYWDVKTSTVRMSELIREHAKGQNAHRSRGSVTFADVAHAWLDYLTQANRAKPSTLTDYRLMLAMPNETKKVGAGRKKARIMRAFGDKKLGSITTLDVDRFLTRLDNQGISTRLVNKHRAILHTVFEWSRKPGTFGLSSNPVSPTEKRRESAPEQVDYFTPEELALVARTAESGAHRMQPDEKYGPDTQAEWDRFNRQDAAMFIVAVETGLRRGELCALRWKDVSFEKRRISVVRAVSGGQIGSPKSGQPRAVPMSLQALQRLDELSKRDRFTKDTDLVFCGYRGNLLDGSSISRRFKEVQNQADIPYRSFHKLRHTFCSQLVAKGASTIQVKEWAGHSSISVTERYLHARSQEDDADFITAAFALDPVEVPAPDRVDQPSKEGTS